MLAKLRVINNVHSESFLVDRISRNLELVNGKHKPEGRNRNRKLCKLPSGRENSREIKHVRAWEIAKLPLSF